MPVVIEHQVDAEAAPAAVFSYLHDPAKRGNWDDSAESSTIEGGSPAAGVRVHVHGRRMAPSWVGEYTSFEPPTRSIVRLVEGEGMPFRSFTQTISVAPRKGGSTVTIRIEYEVAGVVRLIEPLTLRSRLRKVTRRSLARIQDHFA
jgi:carbon monoxide dehydrogenase subunit G